MKLLSQDKKGFTLIEMLIVVGIIIVLLAIALPVYSGQISNARETVDLANARALKAMVLADYLTDELDAGIYYLNADGDDITSDVKEAMSLQNASEGYISAALTITDGEVSVTTTPSLTD